MTYRVAIGPSSFAANEKEPLEILERAGIEVVANPFGRCLTEAETVNHLKGVDGLIAGLEPLNCRVLTSFPQLRAIARVGIGMDNGIWERTNTTVAKPLGDKWIKHQGTSAKYAATEAGRNICWQITLQNKITL